MKINTWTSDRHVSCVGTPEEAPGGGEFQVFDPKFYARIFRIQTELTGGASLRQGLCVEEDSGSVWY